MDDLPNSFDVIVIGTGMPECIIAAAAARVGKTVLHLERNGYYGGDWASFSFDKFLEWFEDTKAATENLIENSISEESLLSFLNENERLALCNLKSNITSNLISKSYISEVSTPPDSLNDVALSSENITVQEGPQVSASDVESEEELREEESSNEYNSTENSVLNNAVSLPVQQEWTLSQFMENRRKFNIDLSPKLLFSRGSLVELLISSNIARYAEFQCVNRVLTLINSHIEQVPCSRADVFSTKNVTVVEKRMLMKFLTFCLKFEENENEYKGFEEATFSQFLKSKKLTPNVEHYILHAIAMVDESCSTLEGLKSTQKFLQSLGRYGKSPFLCTCYGSAELPQCFCRLCAVYGGMYYLKRDVEAIVLNSRCCGIISRNQRIACQWLVMESSYSPSEFLPHNITDRISKAILITDESLYVSEKKENILLKLPPGSNNGAVTILEFSSKTYVCPEDLFIVHMICRSNKATAEEDLMPICDLLFHYQGATSEPQSETTVAPKPNILWCTFFNQMDTSTVDLNSNVPEGLFITSSPDVELDYEHAVKEAQEIFSKMCPEEEFLPRAPDPEDILIERHNNAGDEGDKIENDVSPSDSISEPEVTDGDQIRNDISQPNNIEGAPEDADEDTIENDMKQSDTDDS